jgi:CHAD domain-containing protein
VDRAFEERRLPGDAAGRAAWSEGRMTYRMDPTRATGDEVRRIARDEVGRALLQIEDPDLDHGTTVHEVRKRCKKVRALLRLVQDVAPKLRRRENTAFRDIARTLSDARDADVMLETFDALTSDAGGALGSESRARLRQALVARRERAVPGQGELGERLRTAEELLRSAEERIDAWSLPAKGFEAIEPSLRRSYERARRAAKAALAKPSTTRLHEWRKRTKDHRYHVDLLRDVWKPLLDAHRGELHRMTDLLGEDHDLAVLRETLLEEAGGTDPLAGLTTAVELIDARRASLQDAMPPLGRRLFADKPGAYVRRLRAYHEAARAETEPPS